MIFCPIPMPENIEHFISKMNGQESTKAAQNNDAPIGVRGHDYFLEKSGKNSFVIGLRTINQREAIQADRHRPDKNFAIEHTDAKYQANGKIQ